MPKLPKKPPTTQPRLCLVMEESSDVTVPLVLVVAECADCHCLVVAEHIKKIPAMWDCPEREVCPRCYADWERDSFEGMT